MAKGREKKKQKGSAGAQVTTQAPAVTYAVSLSPKGERSLRKLDKKERDILIAGIDALAHNPKPPKSSPLRGRKDWHWEITHRLRIVYDIDAKARTIVVTYAGWHEGVDY